MAKKPAAIAASVAGEPVHVVEQVEGVGHPDEPEQAERAARATSLPTISTVRPLDERDRGRAELGGELRRAGSA